MFIQNKDKNQPDKSDKPDKAEQKKEYVFNGPTAKMKDGPFKGKTFEKGKKYTDFPKCLAWRMKEVKQEEKPAAEGNGGADNQ